MDPFAKVLDSSIWKTAETHDAVNRKDPYIRIGTIVKVDYDTTAKDVRYIVEVRDRTDKVLVWCKLMTKLGGIFNYEEYSLTGYTQNVLASADSFASKAGDFVIVALLNGEGREGVILGGLKHPGRTSKLNADDGPVYGSEINGVETLINKDGEYSVTYKGVPINVAQLKLPAGAPIAPPIYNPLITGSYFKIDKTGGLELNDKAVVMPQSIKIDKNGGKIEINAGSAQIAMAKLTQAIDIKSNTLSIDSKIKIEQKTIQYSVEATASIKMKALKVAIGSDGVELFDQLIQMIDALGKCQVVSPVGPCTPLMATPQWIGVELIKTKLTLVKGSL